MYIIWLEGKFERAEQYATHKKNLHEQRLTLSTSSLSISLFLYLSLLTYTCLYSVSTSIFDTPVFSTIESMNVLCHYASSSIFSWHILIDLIFITLSSINFCMSFLIHK